MPHLPPPLFPFHLFLFSFSGSIGKLRLRLRDIQLPIDHNNPQVGNFANRYWVMDKFYKHGGPVFCQLVLSAM